MSAGRGSSDDSKSSGSGGEDTDVATLYFGNLHPYVQQRSLEELCAYFGQVETAKVIKDKATNASAGYGFVKFVDKHGAEAALQALNGQSYLGEELRVNWALPNNHKEDTSYHYHIFVGDLGSDVTDAVLYNTFCTVGQCSDARVMWDHNTGRSKGYGFVSFRRKEDAEAAIEVMQSKQIGSRRIRVGWAQHKQEENVAPLDFDAIDRADPSNTNIYIGNISPETNEAGLTNHFTAYGPVAEVKLHKKGGYGFVKFEHHKSAVKAIVGQHGKELDGRILKCSWGKNITSSRTANASASSALSLAAALQSTHLAASAPPALSLSSPSTQSVMASLAAAAAANAAVAAASAGSQQQPFGVVGPTGSGLEAHQQASGFVGPGQQPMPFMPSNGSGLSQGFYGLPAVPAAAPPQCGGLGMGPGGNGMGMPNSAQWMFNQSGLSQMNPSQMALATQMMMVQQGLQQQDALSLQATMAAFNSGAIANLSPAAITSGNLALDPPGGLYHTSGRAQYSGFYGFDGGNQVA